MHGCIEYGRIWNLEKKKPSTFKPFVGTTAVMAMSRKKGLSDLKRTVLDMRSMMAKIESAKNVDAEETEADDWQSRGLQ